MIRLVKEFKILSEGYGKLLEMDESNKTIAYERQGLIFIFNFHVNRSFPDYGFPVPEPGDYRVILNSDSPQFGGTGRIDESTIHTTRYLPETGQHLLYIYNTNRTATVYQRIS